MKKHTWNMIDLRWFGLLVVVSLSFLISCSSSEPFDGYTVKGKYANAASNQIVLERMTPNKFFPVDTSEIKADGSYKLQGVIDKPGFYRLSVKGNTPIMLILENKKIQVNIDGNNPDGIEIIGSDASVNLVGIVTKVMKVGGQMQRLQQQIQREPSQARKSQLQAQSMLMADGQRKDLQQFIEKTMDLSALYACNIYVTSFTQNQEDIDFLTKIKPVIASRYPASEHHTFFANQVDAMVKQFEITQLAEKNKLKIGDEAPEISQASPESTVINLTSLRGKYVLLDFWASWCRPCRAENPNYVRIYNKYKDKDFTIYSVSLDRDRMKWVSAIRNDKLVWESHVSDLKLWQNEAALRYGVNAIPASYLLDPDGNIIAKNLRGAALEAKISEILGG